MTRFILILALLSALAGCGGGPLVRDDYTFKSWLEPERSPGPVQRDGNGNPILPPAAAHQKAETTS